MLRPAGLFALALLSGILAPVTRAVEISVVDAEGKPAARSTIVCIEPASSVSVPAMEGHAVLAAPCRRARCEAASYLPGEVDLGGDAPHCVLRAATRIVGEITAAAAATGLEARLYSLSPAPVGTIPIPKAVAGKLATSFAFPLVKPGRYALELARKSDGWTCRADLGPLAPGRYAVAPAWREPSILNVQVKGADGKPVQGVQVREWSPRPLLTPLDRKATPMGAWICAPSSSTQSTSDATGLARLSIDLSSEALIAAGDWKDARGLAYKVLDRVPSQPISLTLAAPVRVRAKVVDDKDRPVACDALIDGLPADVAWLTAVAPGATTRTTCDAQGGLALGPLTSAALTLDVRPHIGLPIRLSVDAPSPGATADLGILRVRNGESIRVVVHDETGRPVPGAKVTARGSAGVLLSVAGTTGEDGGVDLTGFPKNATMVIEVRAKGFLASRESGLDLDAGPFIVRLARGASISGKVRDTEGSSLGRARIALTGERGDASRLEFADADGAFELDGVDEGAWRLVASATGFAASDPAAVEIRDHNSVSGLTLTLSPAPGISGRVQDGAGTPVGGARVRLVEFLDRDDLAPVAEAFSGSDGAFQLRAAGSQEAWLVATMPGFGPCALRALVDPSHPGEIVLTLTDPAALIVHRPQGARTTRNLVVRDGAGIVRSVAVAGGTDFSFADLAPGRGSASLYGGPESDVALVARETAEVTLEAAAAVEGRVSFEGAPSARARVALFQVSEGSPRMNDSGGSFTDERGRYRIDGLDGGSYRIVAVGEDGRAETTFDVVDGETAKVDLALRSVRLVLNVVDSADAKPVVGVYVAAAPAGKHCHGMLTTSENHDPGELGFEVFASSNGCLSTRTDAAGVARLALAAPGSYDLGVGNESYEPWEQAIALGEGTTTKRVSLTRTPDKAGDKPHVFANLRTDPAGLSGTIWCIAGTNTYSWSPSSGRGDCGAMVPGPGEIVFYVEGYGRGRTAFEVPQTGEIVVDVDVPRGGTVVVPISQAPGAQPALVDGSGFVWSGARGTERVSATLEELPNTGRAWVFRDVPPGGYTVTLDGKTRSPVHLTSGGTAVAY